MTTVYLCPLTTNLQYFTTVGLVLSGGNINTYIAGTSTPQATYTDSTGATPNANPIILNSAGSLPNVQIWQPVGVKIKAVVTDSANNVLFTLDQLAGINDPTGIQQQFYGGTDTGSVGTYVLTVPGFSTYATNGIFVSWIPGVGNTNVGASTVNINGLGSVAITNVNGTALAAGALSAGQIVTMVSQGGSFVLINSALTSNISVGTFLGTFTGFTTTVTATVNYRLANNTAWLYFNTSPPSGTSNTTAMTMTGLPSNLFPSLARNLLCCTEDNGNTEQFSQLAISNAGVCVFYKYSIGSGNFSSTGFTNSGTKGLPPDWNVNYPIT